jgi:hypothetical protein
VLARASLLIRDFLANTNKTALPQPPYSPDLALADFFFFPKLKSTLKGRRFQTIQEITESSQMELRVIPIRAYQDCSQKWQRVGSGASAQEGSTLKVIKAHSVAGMSEKIIKQMVPKLSEQTTYLCLEKLTGIQAICTWSFEGNVKYGVFCATSFTPPGYLWWGLAVQSLSELDFCGLLSFHNSAAYLPRL